MLIFPLHADISRWLTARDGGGKSPQCLVLHSAVMGMLQNLLKAAGGGHTAGLGLEKLNSSRVNDLEPNLPLTHTAG